MRHYVVVLGIWHNDSTAGVGIWCKNCELWLTEPTEDELTPDQIAEVIEAHGDDDGQVAAGQHALMLDLVDEWLEEYGELESYSEQAGQVRDLRVALGSGAFPPE